MMWWSCWNSLQRAIVEVVTPWASDNGDSGSGDWVSDNGESPEGN